ncbi:MULTISPECIES: SDR family oxidoreductase [unclassified Mesorhizobium]|uniref:SDR family oxidoreductase n=1 Tax=unclassified Mesorhizobium TaxID=325217 RepID=UPI003014D77B
MTSADYWTKQRVIITAGASGIGLSIAQAMHDLGAKIWICDIVESGLAEAKALLPGIHTMVCDVADPAACDAFVKAATADMRGLDILVNNAGIAGPAAPVEEISTEDWKRCFEVNVNGQFFMARAVIPHLKKNQSGSIVCMASVAGKYAFGLRSPYASSKAAVIALARALSVELGPDQIRVNAIAPGVVSGDRIKRVFTDRAKTRGVSYDEMAAIALRAVSMKTMVEPEEIAALVVYLTGPSGRPISGQVMQICGGLEYTE